MSMAAIAAFRLIWKGMLTEARHRREKLYRPSQNQGLGGTLAAQATRFRTMVSLATALPSYA